VKRVVISALVTSAITLTSCINHQRELENALQCTIRLPALLIDATNKQNNYNFTNPKT